jgi:hypothetical protein
MIDEPRCSERNCKHFLGVLQKSEEEVGERPYCAAFPGGIPDEIAYGDNDHVSPFPGDHGIQYEMNQDQRSSKLDQALICLDSIVQRLSRYDDADFKESEHPRAGDGKFTSGGSGGGGPSTNNSTINNNNAPKSGARTFDRNKIVSKIRSKMNWDTPDKKGRVVVAHGGSYVSLKLDTPVFFSSDPNIAVDYSDEGSKPLTTYSMDKSSIVSVGSKEWRRQFGDKYEESGPELFSDPPKEVLDYLKKSGKAGYALEDGFYVRLESPKKAGLKPDKTDWHEE